MIDIAEQIENVCSYLRTLKLPARDPTVGMRLTSDEAAGLELIYAKIEKSGNSLKLDGGDFHVLISLFDRFQPQHAEVLLSIVNQYNNMDRVSLNLSGKQKRCLHELQCNFRITSTEAILQVLHREDSRESVRRYKRPENFLSFCSIFSRGLSAENFLKLTISYAIGYEACKGLPDVQDLGDKMVKAVLEIAFKNSIRFGQIVRTDFPL